MSCLTTSLPTVPVAPDTKIVFAISVLLSILANAELTCELPGAKRRRSESVEAKNMGVVPPRSIQLIFILIFNCYMLKQLCQVFSNLPLMLIKDNFLL